AFILYVVSGFSRTVTGPPEGGHYVQVKIALEWRIPRRAAAPRAVRVTRAGTGREQPGLRRFLAPPATERRRRGQAGLTVAGAGRPARLSLPRWRGSCPRRRALAVWTMTSTPSPRSRLHTR